MVEVGEIHIQKNNIKILKRKFVFLLLQQKRKNEVFFFSLYDKREKTVSFSFLLFFLTYVCAFLFS